MRARLSLAMLLAFLNLLIGPEVSATPIDSARAAPTIYLLTPGSPTYVQYPTIEIEYCDDESLNTAGATVRVNGVIVTSSFIAWTPSSPAQCAGGEVFVRLISSTVALNLGDNEIRSRMCDNGNNCTTQIWTVTRNAPRAPVITLVTPAASVNTRTPVVLARYERAALKAVRSSTWRVLPFRGVAPA